MVVGLILADKALALEVDAHIGHELHRVEHQGMGILVLHAADSLGDLVAVAGAVAGVGQPGAELQITGTAALLELLEVVLIAAGGEHNALGGVEFDVAVGVLAIGADHVSGLVRNELDDGRLIQDLRAGFEDTIGEVIAEVRGGGEGDVDGGVPAVVAGGLVIGLAEVELLAGVAEEGQLVVLVLEGELIEPPVDGLLLDLDELAVEVLVGAVAVLGHSLAEPLFRVELHAVHLMDAVGQAADGGGVDGAGVVLLNGDGLEAVLRAGEGGGIARRAEAEAHRRSCRRPQRPGCRPVRTGAI